MIKYFTFLTVFLLSVMQLSGQVTVSASVSDSNPLNLDPITYTVTVTNPDPLFPALGVFALCPIPRGIKFLESEPDQGSYDSTTGIWSVGTVSPSGSLNLKLKTIVNYFNSAYDVRDYYNYNILLKNDATFTGSSVGGKVGAGSDISLVGASIGGLLPTLSPVPAVLNANGYLNFSSGAVFHGNVVYGDSTNLPNASVVYPHGSLVNGNPFNFNAYSLNVNSLSSGLAAHIVNGTSVFASNKLTLTGIDIYLNIFTVAGSDFSGSDSIIINIPKGSIGVVNVLGATLQFTGNVEINGNLNNFIMFNFPFATSVSLIGSRFQGSVLAPLATVHCVGTLVQGQIFADNLESISSHDLSNFIGYIPLNRLILFPVNVSGGNSTVVPLTVNTTPPFGSGGNGTWSVSSVMPDNAWVLSLVRKDSTSILAGTFGGKIYHVDTNGVADTVMNATMLPASAIWSLAVNDSSHIFAATSNGLARSNDNGLTWTETLPNYDVRSVLIGLNGYVYAGTWGFGVFRSTDRGYTWTAQNQNIGSTVINALMDKLDTNALSTPYAIFAAAFQKGLSASFDTTQSWLPLAMPYEFVTALGKTNTGILYIGTQLDGVYRSYDNGNSFHKLSGLPNGPIYSIKVDGDNNIFVSSWMNGIYASSDLGDTWTNLGLGGYGVSSLFAMPNGSLFAGTATGQLLKHSATVTHVNGSVASLPAGYKLEQNYPNPFNPSTQIRISIPAQGEYALTVYNILGQKAATVYSGNLSTGSHAFSFNAKDLPSGMYIYTLTGKGVSLSKKMLLLK
ncbi:MAG: choice-of-anchor A family protein [Ignavibacteriales bacterium]|nr:choice-of-anchor A family protein [Ignavibacteriales bacterium]